MQIVSNVALISINETFLVQLISFLIFLFIINRVMFRPLRKTMNERDTYMAEMEVEIEAAHKGYDDALGNLKAQEAEVRGTALKTSKERESDGTREAEKLFDEARKEIAELKKSAEEEMAAKIEEARSTIAAESEALAVAIMEKILDRRLTS